MEKAGGKMVVAVLQGDDYEATISGLNRDGFFVTVLGSSGGFLKRRSVTLMIGVEETRVEDVLNILRERAGKRTETIYQNVAIGHNSGMSSDPVAPMTKMLGGATVFVLDVEEICKF